jgi:hypothetical protein
MTGSWHLYRPGERWQKSERGARVVLENGQWVAVCFHAPEVELLTEADARRSAAARLGPDLLADGVEPAEIASRWRSRSLQATGLPGGSDRVRAAPALSAPPGLAAVRVPGTGTLSLKPARLGRAVSALGGRRVWQTGGGPQACMPNHLAGGRRAAPPTAREVSPSSVGSRLARRGPPDGRRSAPLVDLDGEQDGITTPMPACGSIDLLGGAQIACGNGKAWKRRASRGTATRIRRRRRPSRRSAAMPRRRRG